MSFEIERKFKLKRFPSNLRYISREKIIQGYIAIEDQGTEVRIRRYGNKYTETIKGPGGLKRKEIEIELTLKQFKQLWSFTKGKRLIKERYTYKVKGKTIEIDVYSGKLDDLIIAEVEFESEVDSIRFMPPRWFGVEVTNDNNYKNSSLAR